MSSRFGVAGNPDVVVATVHNPLVCLQTQSNMSPKQVSWMDYLQRFPFKWRYIPGRTNMAGFRVVPGLESYFIFAIPLTSRHTYVRDPKMRGMAEGS